MVYYKYFTSCIVKLWSIAPIFLALISIGDFAFAIDGFSGGDEEQFEFQLTADELGYFLAAMPEFDSEKPDPELPSVPPVSPIPELLDTIIRLEGLIRAPRASFQDYLKLGKVYADSLGQLKKAKNCFSSATGSPDPIMKKEAHLRLDAVDTKMRKSKCNKKKKRTKRTLKSTGSS